MATKVPSARKYIYLEGAQFRSAVSEELVQRLGGSINWLNDNLKPLNYAYSASCGFVSTAFPTETQITNLSVTITTLGNPVFLQLAPDTSFAPSASPPSITSTVGGGNATLYIKRGSLYVAAIQPYPVHPPGSVSAYDNPPAGTHTYSISCITYSSTVQLTYCILVAQELTP